MSYNPTNWVNGETPINDSNLNHIEQGIKDVADLSDAQESKIADIANNQIPEEYLQSSVDNYIANNQAGLATKTDVNNLDNKLSSEIEENKKDTDRKIIMSYGTNRYNPSEREDAVYLKGDGNGMFSNGAYFTSGFCYIADYETITVQKFNGTSGVGTCRAYEFYGENKTFISGLSNTSITPYGITVPSGAYYVRFSGDSGAENYMLIGGSVYATSFEEYEERYGFTNSKTKKLIFNGDSISAGFTTIGTVIKPYPQQLAEYFGMELHNYSIGGSTISEWGTEGTMPQDRTPIVSRYNDMIDGDIVVIAGGTNDWHYGWCPMGTMEDRVNTTFYGAMHNLCLGLLSKYKGKLIVFCTPIKRRKNDNTPSPNATNPYGYTLKQWCDVIKEVCDYYSIPVLDLYSESMINPHIEEQKALLINDGVHPSQKGHDVIARRIIGFFKQIMG